MKPHGVRGELVVVAFEPGAPNIRKGSSVYALGVRRRIISIRPDRGEWLVLLEGVATRDDAETLRGELLQLPDAEVRRHDGESYFVHELIGLRVETVDGLLVGEIADVITTGANDVYVVPGPLGEVLVPAIGDVIDAIDISTRRVVITPLAGMLDGSS